MRTLPLSELEFAAALAKLTPANPTPEQRELADQLLLQYGDMCLALETLSSDRIRIKNRLADLQVEVTTAAAKSMRPPPVRTQRQPLFIDTPAGQRAVDAINAGMEKPR